MKIMRCIACDQKHRAQSFLCAACRRSYLRLKESSNYGLIAWAARRARWGLRKQPAWSRR